MKVTILFSVVALFIGVTSCTEKEEAISSPETNEVKTEETAVEKNNFVSIFEIPATDISRAISFYEAVLDIDIEAMNMEGMEMGILPFENQLVFGTLIKGDGYEPSADGVTIYLNGGDNLQVSLDKVVENGGEILVEKTPHGDESGFFALFIDSEGNKVGLHSPN